MIRNGPLEKREGTGRRRLWPFGRKAMNRRVRPAAAPPIMVLPDEKTKKTPSRWPSLRLMGKIAGALWAAAALSTGAFFGWRFLTRSEKFAIREVRVDNVAHVSAESVRARAGLELGSNLFAADLDGAAREVQADPWIAQVKLRRELPSVVVIDVVEREPACVLAFGALYLADAHGEAWKRATPDEAAGLPVVTGIPRDGYVDDREASQAMVREALAALAVWREKPGRPSVGEVHVDAADGVTFYTANDVVGVRVGPGDGADPAASWRERLARYDAVAASLAESGEKPRLILVDGRAQPDRVTVRLAAKL